MSDYTKPRLAKEILEERVARNFVNPENMNEDQKAELDRRRKFLDEQKERLDKQLADFHREHEEAYQPDPLPADEIFKIAEHIDPREVASELLKWLTDNVEEYIENKETIFRVYIAVSPEMRNDVPISFLLQDLYMRTPSDDQVVEDQIYDALELIMEAVKVAMDQNEELRAALFKRLAFYYEMTGFDPNTGPVIQEMQGEAIINQVYFDPMPISVQVRQKVGEVVQGEIVEEDDDKIVRGNVIVEGDKQIVVKQVYMPAGFGVEIEISIWQQHNPTVAMY